MKKSSLRPFLPWIGGALGILLALWGVSAAIERMGARPGPLSSPSIQPARSLPAGATAQIDVKVFDEMGKEYALGTPLPRQLSLLIRDAGGQEYSVPFDRVGSWSVDAPDGTYTIPEDQKNLGNWSWKMTGEDARWLLSKRRADR